MGLVEDSEGRVFFAVPAWTKLSLVAVLAGGYMLLKWIFDVITEKLSEPDERH